MLNIKIEMLKRNISVEALAEAIGTHRNSASAKINAPYSPRSNFSNRVKTFPRIG